MTQFGLIVVGAHHGFWLENEVNKSKGKIILIEPVKYNFEQLTGKISDKLGEHQSDTLLARFLCGLTTPIFTRLKVRQLPGFATLEKYRFGEILHWVQENGKKATK